MFISWSMQTATSGVKSPLNSRIQSDNPYESEKLLNEYLLFHYGSDEEVLPYPWGPRDALGYPIRCVRECVDAVRAEGGRALDLGCAVGRSSFELTKICGEVIGIDYSESFVGAAEVIRTRGRLDYSRLDEGQLTTPLEARLPAGVQAERVRFEQGDAMDLRADLGSFDVVLMANLIDRLSSPVRCLARLPELVRPGGQLVVTSPYTWMSEYTPVEEWIGGVERASVRCGTLDGLTAALSGAFERVAVKELPFLIREHARKFQWSVAQASIWRRK